ncbi:hypothetical protein [Paenibacillus mucilaginosus]|uniref:Uncharacterized protein n=1 Tax=Paenibacillus mucilaginosus (strain KNP414) TaxID=1036673 RepID=F8FE64_PAEMK|nr:hypothetical protein [Paenibacillus mucilaginosus]AEI43823.1 hypothetical protein KNP414_05299 [Paenibacillus mucilaginosus KNP414]MCG7212660.1 hypothetical protein [Paenibacillus mucilaginosus]WDM25321.1 hypothetical protein KCX80_23005 [Paenibacillus mucilaginosus]
MIREEAARSGRDQFELRFAAPGARGLELTLLAEILTAVQHAVWTLDPRWLASHKKVPGEVSGDNALEAAAIHTAPYGFRLASRHEADLFGATPATGALQALAELMRDSSDEARLQAGLKHLSPRAAAAYERLLELLLRTKAVVVLRWSSPGGGGLEAALHPGVLESAYRLLQMTNESKSTFTAKGTLAAVNMKRGTFQLDSEDGISYAGKLSGEIKQDIQKGNKIVVPMKADVLLEVTTTFNVSTGSRTEAYRLLQLYSRSDVLGDAQQLRFKETLSRLQKAYDKVERSIPRESGGYGSGDPYDSGGASPLTPGDCTELRELIGSLEEERLADGTPVIGDPAGAAALRELLAPGHPIAQLAETAESTAAGLAGHEYYGDEPDLDPKAQSMLAKAAELLRKREAEAYPELRSLLERLGCVIGALEKLV